MTVVEDKIKHSNFYSGCKS